jgi:hypothetical protein
MSLIKTNHYAECHYAECRVLFIIMLNVVMRIVIVLGVVTPYLSALHGWHWQPTYSIAKWLGC